MNKIWKFVIVLLTSPKFVNFGIFGISAFSLAAALTAQYGFGLLPCVLCVYQRVPFVIASVLGLAGLVAAMRYRLRLANAVIAASGAAFFVNAVIAFYHTGVEQHWWVSSIEGCSSARLSGDTSDILAAIESAPVVFCDVIPWEDPFFGLSMANYNAVMCLCLAAGCCLCFFLIRNHVRKSHEKAQRVGLSWKY